MPSTPKGVAVWIPALRSGIDGKSRLNFHRRTRATRSDAARKAFGKVWREDRVLEAYGAAFARAAQRKGDAELAKALEAGAFEGGGA